MTDGWNESGLRRGMKSIETGADSASAPSTPDSETLPSTPSPQGGGPPPEEFPIIPGYEILSELGRGGMGVVYKARQLTPSRIVALKMVRGFAGWEERLRFLHEAEIVAELQHQNIVHLFEVGSNGDLPFYSMEYLEGGTLSSRLRGKPQPQPPAEAARLMEQIARAVHFANQRGIVHRDLKPANVLFTADGLPKVSDFGVAKRVTGNLALTQSGMLMGTPHYMAPEQARADKTISAGADVYALGAMFYELLAGRPPFVDGESQLHICQRIMTEEPISPAFSRPGLSRTLEAICLKCLQKDPAKRYESAEALADDLARFLSGDTTKARPAGRFTRAVKWVRRHPRRSIAVATLLLAIVAVSYRVYYWDAYQREHIELYESFEGLRWGELQGAVPVSDEQAKHRWRTSRIHRQGRRGVIIAADVINGRGVVVSNEVNLTNWLQGFSGVTNQILASRVAYTHNPNGHVTEETGYDGNGHVLFRLAYDYQKGVAEPRLSVLGRFTSPDGHRMTSPFGAEFVRFRRTPDGRDEQLTFEDADGHPAQNREGVYGLRLSYSPNGRLTRISFTDSAGQPMPNFAGSAHLELIHDSSGRVSAYRLLDRDGKPAAMTGGDMIGVAEIRIDYDSFGNEKARSLFDGAGLPATAFGWSSSQQQLNGSGDREQFSFFDKSGAKADVVGMGGHRIHFDRFDDRGNALEQSYFDADGKCIARETRKYDGADNLLEVSHNRADGGLIYREVRGYDELHRVSAFTFWGPDGKPASQPGGYTRMDVSYNSNGTMKARTFTGYSPSDSVARSVEEFDGRGNLLKFSRFDAKDNLVNGVTGYAIDAKEYDAGNRLIRQTFWTPQGPGYGPSGYHEEVRTYSPAGKLQDVWHQGCRNSESVAKVHERCDSDGHVVEISVLDNQGMLVLDPNQQYARKTITYHPNGNIAEETFFDASDQPRRNIFARKTSDAKNTSGRLWSHDGKAFVPLLDFKANAAGFFTEVFYLESDGLRVSTAGRVARILYEFDDKGRLTGESYLDPLDRPVRRREGYQRLRLTYGPSGAVTERLAFGFDPAVGYSQKLQRLDPQGRILEVRHFDASGKPATDIDGIHHIVCEYNPAGVLLRQDYFGSDDKPLASIRTGARCNFTFGTNGSSQTLEEGFDQSAGFAKRRTEFTGGRIVQVSFLDDAGKPVNAARGYARKVLKYDTDGRVQEISHLDVEEKEVTVEVLVSQVKPGSPADALGLKVGDVIERLDGKPVNGEEQITDPRLQTVKEPRELTLRRQGRKMSVTWESGNLAPALDERAVPRTSATAPTTAPSPATVPVP